MKENNSKLRELVYRVPIRVFRHFIGREIAIGFIEGVLSKVTPSQVLHMIENDQYNLFTGDGKTEKLVKRIKKLFIQNRDVLVATITPENVLAVIREARPDIYSLIINHPKGLEWVRKTVKHSLEYLLS